MEECLHESEVLVCRTVGSSEAFGYQCRTCGRWRGTKKTSLSFHQRQSAAAYDPELSRQYQEKKWQQVRENNEAIRAEQNAAWWEAYDEYLSSQTWKDKRAWVLARDKGECQACLKRPATEVHHLTYKHVGNEPLFELIAICSICHEALTKMDREARGA